MADRTGVYSAGSRPTHVNPRAIEALREIGIDASAQHSKSVDSIPSDAVDLVITLCAEGEEDCPIYPGIVRRLYWPMPDPDAVEGNEEEIMAAFRSVRDELAERIRSLAEDAAAGG
jgi:arsenate reductase